MFNFIHSATRLVLSPYAPNKKQRTFSFTFSMEDKIKNWKFSRPCNLMNGTCTKQKPDIERAVLSQ